MFRITRVRIRWIDTYQPSANAVLMASPAHRTDNTFFHFPWVLRPRHWRIRVSWVGFSSTSLYTAPLTERLSGKINISMLPQVFQIFDPRKLRVRLKWVGFGSMENMPYNASTSAQMVEVPSPGRVLGTIEMPRLRLRLSWLGLGSLNRRNTWMIGLLAILLGIFAFTRLTNVNSGNQPMEPETVLPAGLIADEVRLGDITIRMIHSPLDIGQAKDVFDSDLETLMRGREANPFILDLRFPQPEAIKGLMMDFGRMDFVMRVQVYATDSAKPISYQGEYRQQPAIPHIDMDFVHGPQQVKRLHIEVEQLNPPNEVHIHIREIVFKK